jgi:hypothetical protein
MNCDLALSLVWHRQESMQIGRMLLEQQAADLSDSEMLKFSCSSGAVPTHHSTVFHTVMANIVKHLCFVHVPSWMPLLDFCTWCLQHLTVPLRVWGPAQTAAASTSDASTSTSYGRLGPYRQSTCDILRPFVTFCDHLWPLRKKRWLFSDYLLYGDHIWLFSEFSDYSSFHSVSYVSCHQRWSECFGQCQGHQQQKVNPMSLPPSDCCICCATCLGLFVEVLEIWRNHYWIRRNPKESEGIRRNSDFKEQWRGLKFWPFCLALLGARQTARHSQHLLIISNL